MPSAHALALFVLAALALLAVPGPAVLYVVTQSAEHGRRAGLVSVAGIHLGTLVHTAAAAAGLSALVVESARAFAVVKFAGAAYLVALGLRRLLARDADASGHAPAAPLGRLFWRGALVNVLNPKTALFFLAFVPQFVDADRMVWTQVVAFGLVFVAIGLASDGLYASAAGTLARTLRAHRRALRIGSGTVYVGLGAAAALAKRT